MALRSGVPSEQAFALHHLVKISFERGDKFRFEQFPGLVEGLVDQALEAGNLFYNVNWGICYDGDGDDMATGMLDGVDGTADILAKFALMTPRDVQDGILPAGFTDNLVLITEAVLTLRNMAMMPDNAAYLSDYPILKDLICVILGLPKMEMVVELKHFALDVAEQLTPFLVMDSDDALYQTLLAQLDSTDRGCILTSLRAIGRISMNLAETNKLGGVPSSVLGNIMNWLLLNDDELMDACLDFLYQYTAVVSNVETLLQVTKAENLISHLVRLLSHGAKREHKEFIIEPERKLPGGEDVVPIPPDLLDRLLALDEPERCYQWLRCFFEEDTDAQITQIAIWQAYNTAFLEALKRTNRPMINAAEFIRNISQVYQSAGAQIVREHGPAGEVTRFIIRGIRPRLRPKSPDGREYFRCLWAAKNAQPGGPPKCGVWFSSPEQMYEHIMSYHLDETRNAETQSFENKEVELACKWANCKKYAKPTKMPLVLFMAHVKTHLVTEARRFSSQAKGDSVLSGSSSSKRSKRPYVIPAKTLSLTYEETLTLRDERNPNAPPQAGGIPLSAILVLRNIARNVVKTDSEEDLLKQQETGAEPGGWNERLFRPMLSRLYEILAENKYLAPHITSLLQLLGDLS
jgi:chromatin structure-remodeling complex subunit RSC9